MFVLECIFRLLERIFLYPGCFTTDLYLVHVNFGNEALQSHSEVCLTIANGNNLVINFLDALSVQQGNFTVC